MTGFSLFDTAVGPCAVAWSERGIVAFLLPEGDAEATRRRLLRRLPGAIEGAPPPPVARAVVRVVAHLGGTMDDLADVVLDLDGVSDFNARVFAAARAIPPGRTVTYGEMARGLGDPGAAQAVGKALGENPIPVIVPCHRILAAGGKLHGFSAPGGLATKRRLLEIERARTGDEPDLFDARGPA